MPANRSQEELIRALGIQMRALDTSCQGYDGGDQWEALRLATAAHILVHDYGRTVSLLSQLRWKDRIEFIASGRPTNPRNLLRETPLLKTRVSNTPNGAFAQYLPLLDECIHPYRFMPFSKWWDREQIFRDGKFALTRKKLVFMLRNKEGGAHFDSELVDPDYMRLAREGVTTPRLIGDGMPSQPILGAELASMRQIAWELKTTIDRAAQGMVQ